MTISNSLDLRDHRYMLDQGVNKITKCKRIVISYPMYTYLQTLEIDKSSYKLLRRGFKVYQKVNVTEDKSWIIEILINLKRFEKKIFLFIKVYGQRINIQQKPFYKSVQKRVKI